MPCRDTLSLRPLEREDLKFVHQLNNNASIMRYWFEEPYEAYMELAQLYDKHIHDQQERRFILEVEGTNVGLVELVDIRSIHRRAEFQIIIAPAYQGLCQDSDPEGDEVCLQRAESAQVVSHRRQ